MWIPPKFRILVVEPVGVHQSLFQAVFDRSEEKHGFFHELTIVRGPEGAHRLFLEAKRVENNQPWDIIVLDGGSPFGFGCAGTTSIDLIHFLRENGYQGIIMANSADDTLNQRMVEAGASTKTDNKAYTPWSVMGLLAGKHKQSSQSSDVIV